MADRFDLENELMQLGQTAEDLDTIAEFAIESALDEEGSTDRIANALVGAKELFEMRFRKTFDTFEQLIREGQFKTPKCRKEQEFA